MKFFNVSKRDEVLTILDNFAEGYKLEAEIIKTSEARGRITCFPVTADVNVPAFDRSTVDGYAIKSNESHGATEAISALVDLIGSVDMGKEVKTVISSGEAMYVPTGGMLPAGADSVIMLEDTQQLDEHTICLNKSISIGDNVIHKGDDINMGQVAINSEKKLSAMDIGVLSALGIGEVKVLKKPTVTILSTGDEIIDINEVGTIGQIYDINGYVLENLVIESGGRVIHRDIIKDDYKALFKAVDRASIQSDIVLISGGSSVGTRDYTYEVIKNLEDSEVFVQGIAIKPGKPTIIGCGKGKLVVGLPGHPVSSIMVYKAFIDYYIRKLTGEPVKSIDFEGKLTENVHSSPGKTTYQMVDLSTDNGEFRIVPIYGKSGMISLLAGSKGYIIIEAHQEGLKVGETVMGYYL